MRTLLRTLLVITILFAVVAAVSAGGDGVTVRARVDTDRINIGDRIRYTVEIASRKELDIAMPEFKDGKIGGFEIKDSGAKYRKTIFGNRIYTRFYQVTTYVAGTAIIPAVEVKYRLKGAKDWAKQSTGPVKIAIVSVLPENVNVTDIRDIKGPLGPRGINWILISVIFLAALLIYAAALVYKKLKSRKPVKLPHETALEELEAFKANYAKTGDVKEYFVKISDTVRQYIERRFSLKAPEMTTQEFLDSMKESHALKFEHRDLLKKFLEACDLVKFAKYMPAADEAEGVYLTAKNFVEETKEISKEIEKER